LPPTPGTAAVEIFSFSFSVDEIPHEMGLGVVVAGGATPNWKPAREGLAYTTVKDLIQMKPTTS